MRELNPGIQLVVDPATGDEVVGLYTAPEVVEGYIKHLIPLAGALTPNNFELGLLAEGQGGRSPEEWAGSLLTRTLRWVAVTSAASPSGPGAATVDTLLVTDAGARLVETPLVESRAKGAGDFFLGTTAGALLNGCRLEEAIAAAAIATARALAGGDPYFSAGPWTA